MSTNAEVSDGKKATPVANSVDEQGASDVMGAAAQRTSGALASEGNSQEVFNEAARRIRPIRRKELGLGAGRGRWRPRRGLRSKALGG